MPAKGIVKHGILLHTTHLSYSLIRFLNIKVKRMKSVLIICAGSLATFAAAGNRPDPVDSLKISRDLSLDEVVVTATKVAKGTPVAYSEVSKDELSRKNDGQGIPYLISQSPSVIMTSDAGTGIGYSGFRIRGTDANRINITVNAYRSTTPSLTPFSGPTCPISHLPSITYRYNGEPGHRPTEPPPSVPPSPCKRKSRT